jgi:hypothetical protein
MAKSEKHIPTVASPKGRPTHDGYMSRIKSQNQRFDAWLQKNKVNYSIN